MPKLFTCSILTLLLSTSILAADRAPAGNTAPAADRVEVCQTAVLHNGSTIQYVRREVVGAATRLWVCADSGAGYMEFPSEQIARYEQWGITVRVPSESAPAATPVGSPAVQEPVEKLITGAASRHELDPDFVASVVKAESGFNPKAISPKGAQGLMQLMPQTAADLGVGNSFDPAANVEGGTKYLRQLLDQYKGDAVKALAAYNAGPQRVDQYGGVPPYTETREFVARVINDFNRKKLRQQAESRAANQ